MDKQYTLILVPETHWDREWYATFQEFRIRLVRLTDKLLGILDSDPDYTSFTFDGQTIVLEDYLHIRPQGRERIAKHVQAGRLLVGPWYVLPDEFLVSAEAMVRNLMLGHMISEQFGRTMKAGYIPDPFGHISQLPQIIAGFGIPSVYFTRGMGDEADQMHSEFWWEAPDGTKVLAVNQPNGYCNACNLGYEQVDGGVRVNFDLALQQVRDQLSSLSARASTRNILLNNGCDHLEPQHELPEIIRYVNERLEDGEVVHSTYEDYAARVLEAKPELKTFRGELHRGKYHPLLLGVFSARMYIKQANERTQTLLEKWAEPGSALAWMHGGAYDHQLLWEAWKLCIQNHPHDSICGCSIDQVHREMMPRFEQSQQISEVLARESLGYLANKIDTSRESQADGARAIVVFNPHAWEASETVRVHVEKHLAVGERPPAYVVKTADGQDVVSQITGEYLQEINGRHQTWHADVCFQADHLPPLGYETYYLESGTSSAETALVCGLDYIENDLVRLNVRCNGTFDLHHKKTRTTYHNLNLFEDTEDVGDEYNYGWARNSRTITSEARRGTLSVVERGPAFATIRADTVLELPVGLTEDRLSRSEETVRCPVRVYVTVHAHSPRVDVVTVFENNARDHRLRAHFPIGEAPEVCYAEGQFDVVERPVDQPAGDDWVERPVGQKPVQSYVAVDLPDGGLAVINQGLPEYEIVRGRPATIAQTLLRCCGWLSRDDYEARPYNAGPSLPTPDAQCLGTHTFRYAVYPYTGTWKKAKVWRQAHQHNVPPRAVLTEQHPGELPRSRSFVSVEPENVIVTAVKKAERSDALVVRLLNTTPEGVRASLRTSLKIRTASLTNLNEERTGQQAEMENGSVRFDMPGFRVQTVMLEFQDGGRRAKPKNKM